MHFVVHQLRVVVVVHTHQPVYLMVVVRRTVQAQVEVPQQVARMSRLVVHKSRRVVRMFGRVVRMFGLVVHMFGLVVHMFPLVDHKLVLVGHKWALVTQRRVLVSNLLADKELHLLALMALIPVELKMAVDDY